MPTSIGWSRNPHIALLLLLHGSCRATMSCGAGIPNANSEPRVSGGKTAIVAAVLFDLDGTLVDTESLSDQAMLRALQPFVAEDSWDQLFRAHRQHRLPWELKRQILGLRGSDWGPIVVQYAIDHWGVLPDKAPAVRELWDAWESHLDDLCGTVEACDGAYQVVERLASQGVPLAIATSSRASAAHKKLQRHPRIARHMRAVVAGDDPAVSNGKPAPDIYVEAARRLGVPPQRCLVFEDAMAGCRSGKAAGCVVVAVPDERFTQPERAEFAKVADFVI